MLTRIAAAVIVTLALSFALLAGNAIAQEDVTPPTLIDVTFEPGVIDTGKGPVTITVTIHVQDDLSGFKDGGIEFALPGTTQSHYAQIQPFHKPSEGTNLDGHYVVDMVLPQYSGYGTWVMRAYAVVDNVGNRIVVYRPEDSQGLTGPTWPSLFNQFGFVVGTDATEPQFSIFLPAMAQATVPTAAYDAK